MARNRRVLADSDSEVLFLASFNLFPISLISAWCLLFAVQDGGDGGNNGEVSVFVLFVWSFNFGPVFERRSSSLCMF